MNPKMKAALQNAERADREGRSMVRKGAFVQGAVLLAFGPLAAQSNEQPIFGAMAIFMFASFILIGFLNARLARKILTLRDVIAEANLLN